MADWSANGTDNAHPTGWRPAQDGAHEHPLVYVLPDSAYYGARVQHAPVYAPAPDVPSAVPFPSQALPFGHPMHYPPSAADRPLRRRSVTAPSSYFPHHASPPPSFEPMPPAFGQAPAVFAAPTLYQGYAPVEPTAAAPSAPPLVSPTSRAAPARSTRRSRTRSSRRRRTPEASSSSGTPRDPADPAPSTVRRTRKKLRQDASHVNRPMNMFILFRNDWVRRHRAEGHAAGTAAHHSAEASVAWRALGPDERAVWAAKADEEKVKHAAAHPDYVYRPRRRDQSAETPASEAGHDEPVASFDDAQVSPSALPFAFGEYSPTGPPFPPLHAPTASVLPLRALPMQLSHSLPLPPRPSSTDLAMPSPTRATREVNRRSLSAHGLRAFGEHARVWFPAEEDMSVHNTFAQAEQNPFAYHVPSEPFAPDMIDASGAGPATYATASPYFLAQPTPAPMPAPELFAYGPSPPPSGQSTMSISTAVSSIYTASGASSAAASPAPAFLDPLFAPTAMLNSWASTPTAATFSIGFPSRPAVDTTLASGSAHASPGPDDSFLDLDFEMDSADFAFHPHSQHSQTYPGSS